MKFRPGGSVPVQACSVQALYAFPRNRFSTLRVTCSVVKSPRARPVSHSQLPTHVRDRFDDARIRVS
ncbi:MAG: hypothetical protein J0H77_04370 [Alphaproteobacteria bacterium]|jgi:hypothetical protein|nr:hypothetical protein [Alphaproteobacteria bacterium]